MNAYLQQSQRPIVILMFLLPFIVIAELGVRNFGVAVAAGTLLGRLIGTLGIYGTGTIVPAMLVVLTLIIWHLVRQDRWGFQPKTLFYMALESFLFALPIFAILYLCRQHLPLMAGLSRNSLVSMWCLSLGAGVYEEMLFRLLICGSIYLASVYAFKAKPTGGWIIAVILSSVLFSVYHYLGNEHFTMFSFVFRGLAGVYFAVLFSLRGFGITAGSHAFYDVIVVSLAHL